MNTFTDGLHLFQHETGVTNWGAELNNSLAEVDRALFSMGARPLHFDKRVRSLSGVVSGREVTVETVALEVDGAYVTHAGGTLGIPTNPAPGDRLDLLVVDPSLTSGLTRIEGIPATQWQQKSARRIRVFDKNTGALGSLVAPGAVFAVIADVLFDPVNTRWLLAYVSEGGGLIGLPASGPPMVDLAVFDPDVETVTPLNMNWRLSPALSSLGPLFGVSPFGLSILPNASGTGSRLFGFASTGNAAVFLEFDATGEAVASWGLTNAQGNLLTAGAMHLMDLGPELLGRRVRVVGMGLGVLPWHGLNLGSFVCEALLPENPSPATLGGLPAPFPVAGMPITGPVSQFGERGEMEAISVAMDTGRNKLFAIQAPVTEGGFKQELPRESLLTRTTTPFWKFLLWVAAETAGNLNAYGLSAEADQPLSGATVSFPDAIALYDTPVFTAVGASTTTAFLQQAGVLVVAWPNGGGNLPGYPWPAVGDSLAVLVEFSTGVPAQKEFAVLTATVVANPSGQTGMQGMVLSSGDLLKGTFPQENQSTLERVYLGRVIPDGSTYSARLIHVDGVPLEQIQGRLIKVSYTDPAGEGTFTWLTRAGCPWNRPYQFGVKNYGGTEGQGSPALSLLAFPGDLWVTYEGSLSSSNGRGVPYGTWPLGLELNRIAANEIIVGPYGGTFSFDAGTVFHYDDGFNQVQWQDPAAGPTQLPKLDNTTLTVGSAIADYRQLDTSQLFVLPPQDAWNFTAKVLGDPSKYSLDLVGRLLPEESGLPAPVFSAFGAVTGVGYGDGELLVSSLSLNSLPGGALAVWEPYEAPIAPNAPAGLVPVAQVWVRGGHTGDIATDDLRLGPDHHLPVLAKETLLESVMRSTGNAGDLLGGLGVFSRLLQEGVV